MNAIIIDDDTMSRAIIMQLSKLHPKIKVVNEFSNAMDAIKYLNHHSVDLIFLDIHMPNFTGFDFINTVKKLPHIILVTADQNFAIEAFEFDCVIDYLVKPISEERFQKTINKLHYVSAFQKQDAMVFESNESSNFKDLFINIDRRLVKIEYASVEVIEAKGDYIYIKTDKQNYKVHATLKKIEDRLPRDLFLKVHRSFIINFKKIIDIEDNSVLISKYVIPVSKSNRSELMSQLNLL